MCMPPRDRARSHCGFRTWTSGLQRTVVDIRHDLFNCESVPSLGSRCMLCESNANGCLSIRGSAPLPFNAQRLHKCGTRAYSLLLLAPGGYSIVPGK